MKSNNLLQFNTSKVKIKYIGEMKTGWLQDNGEWYYFNSKGKMQTGLINIDGNDYQFDESSGQLQIDEGTGKTAFEPSD